MHTLECMVDGGYPGVKVLESRVVLLAVSRVISTLHRVHQPNNEQKERKIFTEIE